MILDNFINVVSARNDVSYEFTGKYYKKGILYKWILVRPTEWRPPSYISNGPLLSVLIAKALGKINDWNIKNG